MKNKKILPTTDVPGFFESIDRLTDEQKKRVGDKMEAEALEQKAWDAHNHRFQLLIKMNAEYKDYQWVYGFLAGAQSTQAEVRELKIALTDILNINVGNPEKYRNAVKEIASITINKKRSSNP